MFGFTKGLILVKLFGIVSCFDSTYKKAFSAAFWDIHTSDVNTTALSDCKQEGSYITQFKDL